MRRRIQVGRELRVLAETADGLHLEGLMRLHPGQLIDVVFEAAVQPSMRSAYIVSWSVARLGKDGPTYHGLCRWQPGAGTGYPP